MPFYLCSPTSDFCNSYSTSRFTNVVRSGSLCDARRMASVASWMVTPSISNKIFPGFTTATQWSGAPLPLPIRVSAGFFVTGLSGNTRIQILPPRFTKRVIATRLASICRSVIHPGSRTFNPKSPKDNVEPRHALPVMRPRCCLRYFTFFGINIEISSQLSALGSQLNLFLESANRRLPFALLGREKFSLVDPALHANHTVGGSRFGETIVNVGAQRVQRQTALQVPLRPRDFIAVQPAAYPDLDSFAAETKRRVHGFTHGPAETNPLLKLQRNRLGDQLRVQLRLMHFLDVDKNIFTRGPLLQVGLELVDFCALAPDDDARPRRLDNDPQLVARPLDFNRADTRRLEFVLQFGFQLDVLVQLFVVIPLGKPTRLPRLGVAEAKTIRMDFLSHCFS